MKVWSKTEQREYTLPDYNDPNYWIPQSDIVFFTIIVAISLTFLRKWVQDWVMKYAERHKIKEGRKFSESTWKCMFYLFVWIWELYELYNCDWFPETINCWKGFPNLTPVGGTLKALYIFQFGFYWHTLYAHFTMEVKREDYWILFCHHLVTLVLIYWSYAIKFERIGLLVLVTHDTNDVFLELGKTYVYRKNEFMTNLVFSIVITSWLITRLGIFPFKVIYSSLYESIKVVPYDIATSCFYWEFNVLLIFLLCLHIYWFWLMLKILWGIVSGKQKVKDIREDEDEKTKAKNS